MSHAPTSRNVNTHAEVRTDPRYASVRADVYLFTAPWLRACLRVIVVAMETRREEDERHRTLLEDAYGPAGQLVAPAVTVSGAPPAPALAVRLPKSASEVATLLRTSPVIAPLEISTEWSTPAYAHRDQLLLDESGPHLRLWLRPPIDEITLHVLAEALADDLRAWSETLVADCPQHRGSSA